VRVRIEDGLMGRAHGAVAYVILLATCVAGVFHAPWWAACAGASALALLSLFGQRAATVPQLRTVSEPVLVIASVLNAAAVASGAFIFGHVARWFWGL
jgi:hypothetical protein